METALEKKWEVVTAMTSLLASEKAAFDIATHRAAPAGLRIWSGGTIENEDLKRLLPWLDWGWQTTRSTYI